MRLGLGTVQFGLSYGINNKLGKTSSEECKKIRSDESPISNRCKNNPTNRVAKGRGPPIFCFTAF